jgi:DMSO/TMAO reductase YedYZ heme-binding membrane subunit
MVISRFTKSVVILDCSVPAILLAWDAVEGDLGANPVNFSIRTTGILSLIFLVLTLTVTPVTRLSGWSWLGQFRRVMGLYAFFLPSVTSASSFSSIAQAVLSTPFRKSACVCT